MFVSDSFSFYFIKVLFFGWLTGRGMHARGEGEERARGRKGGRTSKLRDFENGRILLIFMTRRSLFSKKKSTLYHRYL